MNNFAVKFASDLTTEDLAIKGLEGIPPSWPVEIVELGESSQLPDDGSSWTLMTEIDFTAHKTTMQSAYADWYNSKQQSTANAIISNKIRAAMTFGFELTVAAATSNVLAGITQAGKTQAFSLYCHDLNYYLTTGSLYAAIQEINTMLSDTSAEKANLAPFLTNDLLTEYKYKIQDYLGVPRA